MDDFFDMDEFMIDPEEQPVEDWELFDTGQSSDIFSSGQPQDIFNTNEKLI